MKFKSDIPRYQNVPDVPAPDSPGFHSLDCESCGKQFSAPRSLRSGLCEACLVLAAVAEEASNV